MKTISNTLDAHLRQEVTTICTCWQVVRQDGQVFCFTDHDQDLVFEGRTYESETGYNRTAITGDESFAVDNADVTGFLESDRISENDLRNGLFDQAKVFVFGINWKDISQGVIKLRRGWLGEVIVNANGSFEVELRGLHQALSFNFMESYQPECRADFCDARCKLNYADFVRAGTVFSTLTRSQFRITQSAYTPPVGHRYWKIQPTALNVLATRVGFAEVRFYDQTGAEVLGGTASAQTQALFGEAPNARDQDLGDFWAATDTTSWWKIDFGSAKIIGSLAITAENFLGHEADAPTGFDLLYSDDNVTWTLAKSFTTTNYTSGEVKNFVGIGQTVPVAPATGAGNYIGGTVKFTSGPNTGKIIEIIAYDAATGLVTMFEDFPYEITAGDALELVQGCDKMFNTCKLYANQVNFRGEPHVPGQDAFLSYPDAQE